eukprot:CAMPEP_0185495938 /NCGR_PEP_ID=MMETSP1366-20130426/17928_1 /TAXON_ID=38817 /ORGANISM="Gephyrocapsa oceanica, Strain RCC1303" /LENGTH=235 /DNA_ID=CAMNT_0028104985 /DNA_START=130 /DNA_END=834 /DNA_ORIENTATION=+
MGFNLVPAAARHVQRVARLKRHLLQPQRRRSARRALVGLSRRYGARLLLYGELLVAEGEGAAADGADEDVVKAVAVQLRARASASDEELAHPAWRTEGGREQPGEAGLFRVRRKPAAGGRVERLDEVPARPVAAEPLRWLVEEALQRRLARHGGGEHRARRVAAVEPQLARRAHKRAHRRIGGPLAESGRRVLGPAAPRAGDARQPAGGRAHQQRRLRPTRGAQSGPERLGRGVR